MRSPGRKLLVEILIPDPGLLGALRDEMPTEQALFFLRNRGQEVKALGFPKTAWEAESPYYRLIFSEAVFRDISGRVFARPGAETGMARDLPGTVFRALLDDVEATLRSSE